MEGTDERGETIEAEEKNGAKEKGGMRQVREGERQDRKEKESGRTGKKRRAGSCRNVVGKTEWEETK